MPQTAAVHPDGADADSPARMKLGILIYTMVTKMNPPKRAGRRAALRDLLENLENRPHSFHHCGKPVHHLCAAFDRRQKNL